MYLPLSSSFHIRIRFVHTIWLFLYIRMHVYLYIRMLHISITSMFSIMYILILYIRFPPLIILMRIACKNPFNTESRPRSPFPTHGKGSGGEDGVPCAARRSSLKIKKVLKINLSINRIQLRPLQNLRVRFVNYAT